MIVITKQVLFMLLLCVKILYVIEAKIFATRKRWTMEKYTLTADFCVVGGGLAGMAAAVAAARHGVKTIIIQDRPMFGGNSSSEIRMHVCGAHGENRRETGFVEELLLDNFYYNYSV